MAIDHSAAPGSPHAAAPRPITARERARAYEVAPPTAKPGKGRALATNRHRMPARDHRAVEAALMVLERHLSTAEVYSSPSAVKDYLRLQLGDQAREQFGVMFLDAQNRLIVFEVLFAGTLTHTAVYPREVVLRALSHNAASVVLAHNHPSGSTQPSRADEALTATLKAALALVDVRVLDHAIVTRADALSMAERGLL